MVVHSWWSLPGNGAFQGPSSLLFLIGLSWKPEHRTVLEGRVVQKGRGGQAVVAGGMGGGKEGQGESEPSGSSRTIRAGGGLLPWYGSPELPTRIQLS